MEKCMLKLLLLEESYFFFKIYLFLVTFYS